MTLEEAVTMLKSATNSAEVFGENTTKELVNNTYKQMAYLML